MMIHPDGTRLVAGEIARRLSLPLTILVRRARPRSLAESILMGALHAQFSVVAAMDCDLSHDPGDLPLLVDPLLSGRADLAIGARYLDGSTIGPWPLRRRLLSLAGSVFSRPLAHVRDPLSGFFALRKEALLRIRDGLRPRGYKLLLEILARSPDLPVVEVGISFRDRSSGRSKLGFRQIFEFAVQLVELFACRLCRVIGGVDPALAAVGGARCGRSGCLSCQAP